MDAKELNVAKVTTKGFDPNDQKQINDIVLGAYQDFSATVNTINDNDTDPTKILLHKETLTAAQIKTANAVPVALAIPYVAEGHSKHSIQAIPVLHKFMYRFNPGEDPFINFTQAGIIPSQGSLGAAMFYIEASILTGEDEKIVDAYRAVESASMEVIEHQEYCFKTDADSEEGDGTMDIWVWYSIVSI